MATIVVLKNRGKGLKITELSNIFDMPPSAITPLINSLEEKGFVRRKNSPTDRRIVIAELTEKGFDFFEKNNKLFLEKAEQLCEYLGEEDSQTLIRITNKVSDFFNQTCDSETNTHEQ